MRVLLDGIVFSLQTCGGISGMFSRLISGLAEQPGVELYLLERSDAERNIFRNAVSLPKDRIIVNDRLPLRIARYMPAHGLPLTLSQGEPYIFHSSYYRTCCDPLALNVTTLHDFTYEVMRLRGFAATQVHSRQKRAAVRRSLGLACVSNATLADYRRLIGEDARRLTTVIPNAPLCLHDAREAWPKRAMQNVLYVGARSYHKNFSLVVRALSGTPWRLVLCSSELSSEEYDMVRHHLRPGQYEICVSPDDKTLSRMYSSARCLIYPSSYEGFGIPILEAQEHGLPVITGNCPSSVEVGAGSTIVLADYTEQAVREAIASLDDKALYCRISERGRKNASRYRWADIVEAYVDLYRGVLSRSEM